MTFEEYWEKNAIKTGQTEILDQWVKEISQKAWNAALDASVAEIWERIPLIDNDLDVMEVNSMVLNIQGLKA